MDKMPHGLRMVRWPYYAAAIPGEGIEKEVGYAAMRQLSIEQTEYAVGTLVRLVRHRGVTQTQLQEDTGVAQSTISKILTHAHESPREGLINR